MLANDKIVVHGANHNIALSSQAELVRDALLVAGLETPMVDNGLSAEEKRLRIKQSMTEVMQP
jgi:GTP cyclohydrolase I